MSKDTMSKRPHPSSKDCHRGASSSGSSTGSEASSHSRRQSNSNSCHRPRDERRQLPSLTESIPEYRTHLPSTSRQPSRANGDATGPARNFASTSTSAANSKPSRKHQRKDSDGSHSATLAIHSGPPSRYNESVSSSPRTVADNRVHPSPTQIGGVGSRSANIHVESAVKTAEASSNTYREFAGPDRGHDSRRNNETLPSLPSMFGSRQPPVPPPPCPVERPRENQYQYPSPTSVQCVDPTRSVPPSPYYTGIPPNAYPSGPPHLVPSRPQPAQQYVSAQRESTEPTYPLPPLHPQCSPTGYGYPHDPRMNGPVSYHPGVGMMAYSAFENMDMSDQSNRRRRGNLPKDATHLFKTWLQGHVSNPYPTEEEKQWMQEQTGMSASQVSNWFINARRRILPQMTRSAQTEHSFTNGSNSTTTTPPGVGSIGNNSPHDQSILDSQLDSSQNSHYNNGNNSGNVSSLDPSASNSPSMLLPPPPPSTYPRGH